SKVEFRASQPAFLRPPPTALATQFRARKIALKSLAHRRLSKKCEIKARKSASFAYGAPCCYALTTYNEQSGGVSSRWSRTGGLKGPSNKRIVMKRPFSDLPKPISRPRARS